MPTYEVEVTFRDREVLIVDAVNEDDAETQAIAELKAEYYPGVDAFDFKVEGIVEVV